MKKRHKKALYWIIAIVAVVTAAWAINSYSNQPGELDSFAQCLEDQGATFYGAYWCPACNQQKTMFGRSQDLLPYEECSLPNRGGRNELCTGLGIEGYPTWEFPDGERVTGVVSLEELSRKTSCELPS